MINTLTVVSLTYCADSVDGANKIGVSNGSVSSFNGPHWFTVGNGLLSENCSISTARIKVSIDKSTQKVNQSHHSHYV